MQKTASKSCWRLKVASIYTKFWSEISLNGKHERDARATISADLTNILFKKFIENIFLY